MNQAYFFHLFFLKHCFHRGKSVFLLMFHLKRSDIHFTLSATQQVELTLLSEFLGISSVTKLAVKCQNASSESCQNILLRLWNKFRCQENKKKEIQINSTEKGFWRSRGHSPWLLQFWDLEWRRVSARKEWPCREGLVCCMTAGWNVRRKMKEKTSSLTLLYDMVES